MSLTRRVNALDKVKQLENVTILISYERERVTRTCAAVDLQELVTSLQSHEIMSRPWVHVELSCRQENSKGEVAPLRGHTTVKTPFDLESWIYNQLPTMNDYIHEIHEGRLNKLI